MKEKLIIILMLATMAIGTQAQERKVQNKPYIDLRTLHFGILLGLHMQDVEMDNVGPQVIDLPEGGQIDGNVLCDQDNWNPGFSVGVLADLRLSQHFNLRFSPSMHFGQKRLTFRNMLDLVKCWGHNEHSKGFRYGTKEFHVVWEKMVDSVFGNVGNKEDYNPKLVYNTRAKDSPHPIIPDTIMILGKDEMFILDSKYYKFAMGEHPDNSGLPGSDSILKQIAYARYAQNMHKGSRIYNAFVMPYNERFSEAFRYPCEGKAVDSDAMQSTEHAASSGESVLPMCIAGYCDATALAPTHSTPDNSCTDDAETRQVPFYKILLVLIDTTALLNHFADIKKDDARNALANMIHYAQRRS